MLMPMPVYLNAPNTVHTVQSSTPPHKQKTKDLIIDFKNHLICNQHIAHTKCCLPNLQKIGLCYKEKLKGYIA